MHSKKEEIIWFLCTCSIVTWESRTQLSDILVKLISVSDFSSAVNEYTPPPPTSPPRGRDVLNLRACATPSRDLPTLLRKERQLQLVTAGQDLADREYTRSTAAFVIVIHVHYIILCTYRHTATSYMYLKRGLTCTQCINKTCTPSREFYITF